ncbi:MAG: CDP-diacylglycerol--glycerol-3-phosphate 3-phosphatidyltransferase [Oscillospiraceae bacterium]|nr:CDP-diacylglycerol--glycerol-3-phosphate 3-phosphatidyltransferase [Oscillospiraceae bacterium]
MNLANKLTFLRVLMIPLFVIFLLLGGAHRGNVIPDGAIPFGTLWAMLIFIIACITDALDGHIARKRNMVTDLGKLMDPLADKVLVISALVCFVELGWAPAWAIITIIAREFIVTGFRLAIVAKDNKAVIAADIWGKIKTGFTMGVIIAAMFFNTVAKDFGFLRTIDKGTNESVMDWVITFYFPYNWIYEIGIFVCVALTVFSGITMIYKNRKLFSK